MVFTRQLDEAGASDVLGVEAPLVNRAELITGAMEHQRRHLDRGKNRSHVHLGEHLEHGQHGARRERLALEAGPELTGSFVAERGGRRHHL